MTNPNNRCIETNPRYFLLFLLLRRTQTIVVLKQRRDYCKYAFLERDEPKQSLYWNDENEFIKNFDEFDEPKQSLYWNAFLFNGCTECVNDEPKQSLYWNARAYWFQNSFLPLDEPKQSLYWNSNFTRPLAAFISGRTQTIVVLKLGKCNLVAIAFQGRTQTIVVLKLV